MALLVERTDQRIQRDQQHCDPVADECDHCKCVKDFVKAIVAGEWVGAFEAIDYGAHGVTQATDQNKVHCD